MRTIRMMTPSPTQSIILFLPPVGPTAEGGWLAGGGAAGDGAGAGAGPPAGGGVSVGGGAVGVWVGVPVGSIIIPFDY